MTAPAVWSVDTNLLTPSVIFITFIDITVSFILRVSAVRHSVTDVSQRNTTGVSAEKIVGQITGEIRAIRLVGTIRTVGGAITELVSGNTL